VLFYNGWSTVGVPITEADAEDERKRRRKVSTTSKAEVKKKGPVYKSIGEEVLDWCSYINTFDVCITTYNTLRQDLNVARPVPKRPRREDVVYSNVEKPRSPLVMCEWYRVIMDEVRCHLSFVLRAVLIYRISGSNGGWWKNRVSVIIFYRFVVAKS
jgi:E3 ubiquitin-protein ligase SHPRH